MKDNSKRVWRQRRPSGKAALTVTLLATSLLPGVRVIAQTPDQGTPTTPAQMALRQYLQRQFRERVGWVQTRRAMKGAPGGAPLVPFFTQAGGAEYSANRLASKMDPANPPEAWRYQEALRQRDRMPQAQARASTGSSSGIGDSSLVRINRVNIANTSTLWQSVGPAFVESVNGDELGANLIAGGRVNGIAFDKNGRLYAATASGGLWRYDNIDPFAAIVAPTPLTDKNFSVLQTSSVAVHPTNANIIFVGTGDYDAGDGRFGVGIYKSVNGGISWSNVGNGSPGVLPPPTPTTANTQMEGTAVSCIVINPEIPSEVVASSGRGINAGFIWYSVDTGSNWQKATLANGSPLPAGNWSGITIGVINAQKRLTPSGGRAYYAARENDGIYRSDDRGHTWAKLPVPLVYNGTGLATGVGLKVAASQRVGNPDIVYVVDVGTSFADGRIFKSLDQGATWINITGDFPTAEAVSNNFTPAAYSLVLASIPSDVTVFDTNGNAKDVLRDTLYGGIAFMATSLGGINQDGGIFGSSTSTTPIRLADVGASVDWSQIDHAPSFPFPPQFDPHLFYHAIAPNPIYNPTLFNYIAVGTDGGLYGLISNLFGVSQYQSAGLNNFPTFFSDPIWTFDQEFGYQPNERFVISQFENADFMQVGTQIKAIGPSARNEVITGSFNFEPSQVQAISDLNFFEGLTDIGVVWSTLSTATTALVPDSLVNSNATTNPDGIPGNGTFWGLRIRPDTSRFVFNPFDTTGNTQFIITGSTGNWNGNTDGRRIYYTTNNWVSCLDISPDRYLLDANRNPARDKNGAAPLYMFNTQQPKDSTTPTNWQGETKPEQGMPIAFGLAPNITQVFTANPPTPQELGSTASVMYTGGQYLWRYDPAGNLTKNPLPGPDVANSGSAPNRDHGVWRRVGGTQLAASGSTISAITVSIDPSAAANKRFQRIYIGTTAGDVWVSRNALDENLASTPIPGLTATWTKIAGPGVANATLPNRPVLAIRVNEDGGGALNGDIIVALGGGPGVPHLWRNTNTQGNAAPIFVAASGTGFAALPDVNVNDVVRDPDDSTNTFYAATELGVFTSIDGGATWNNATTALGLPNVECTTIKVVPPTAGVDHQLIVSTYGRGVWRFDMRNLVSTNAGPNLVFGQSVIRVGNEFVMNVTIKNDKNKVDAQGNPLPVGSAFNVQLKTANLNINNAIINTSTIPASGSINVGNIGPDETRVVTLRFPIPATGVRPGSSGIFKVGGTYTLPPFPPGTTVNFNNDPGVRLRLP